MKLPHITIEYREDENYAIGKMSAWLIVGLALNLAWVMATLMNGPNLIFPNAAYAKDVLNSTAMFTNACAFLCYGIFHVRMRHLFRTAKRRNTLRLIAALLVMASVLIMSLANAFPSAAVPLMVAAGLLAGIGNTVLTMSFAVSFSVCDVATAGMSAGLSFSLAALIYVLISSYLRGLFVLCTALSLICPLVEFFFLNRCSYQLVDRLKFRALTIPVKAGPFALHVILPCLLIGFCISFARVHLINSFALASDPSSAVIANISATALSLLVIIGAILTQRQQLNFMARTLFPVCALALAALVCVGRNELFAVFVFSLVYILLDCAIWVTLSDMAQRFRISAFIAFGFGYGSVLLGGVVSYHMIELGGILSSLSANTPALVCIGLAVLMFGYALLPSTAEILSSLKTKGACPAFTGDELEIEMLHDPDRPDLGNGPEESRDDEEAEEPRTEERTAVPIASEAPDESETGDHVESVQEQDEEPEVSPDEMFDDLNTRDEHKALEARTKSDHPGRFKRKCAKVAETYLLSRKETEVLFLLAKGRNAAAIQEALYIAPGTANTHMRHIYRKLDVHSQQELIELVENTELDDEMALDKSA